MGDATSEAKGTSRAGVKGISEAEGVSGAGSSEQKTLKRGKNSQVTGLTGDLRLIVGDSQGLYALPLSDGEIVVGSGGEPIATTVAGVTNQTMVTAGAGALSIGTAQDIGTGSTPTFAGVNAATIN